MSDSPKDVIKSAEALLARLNGETNDSTSLVHSGHTSGSSSDHPSSGTLEEPQEIQLDFGTEEPSVPFALNFGFNEEDDEEGETIVTYRETRSFQADVVTFIERHYYAVGELPKWKLLHDTFKDYPEAPRYMKNWRGVIDDLQDRGVLEARGLPTYRTAEDYLDPKFILACHRILNFRDKRTDSAKLKEIGVKVAQWNAWLKRSRYFEYYKEQADKIFDQELQTEAKRGLTQLVSNADLSAIKYLDERTGVYRGANGSNMEVIGIVIQAIMAILARTVPVDVINTVAAELRNEPAVMGLLTEGEKEQPFGFIESRAS